MEESYNLSSLMVVKRRSRKLPSTSRHAVIALICILVLPATIYGTLKSFGNPKDSVAIGYVGVEPIPLPAASDNLNGDSSALPDLLRGDVPENVNPTETLDALGNPLNANNTPESDKSGLAGGNTTDTPATIIPQPAVSGPKTILIDGQPLDGTNGSTILYPGNPLPRAPIAGLTRASPFGQMPTPAPDGRKAVTSYARPYAPTPGTNSVSLIIGGLGIDRNLTRRFINELPPDVSLSFAAHANGLQTWIDQARARGHEVLVELPMEGASFDPSEPGADKALLTSKSAAQNIRNLDWLLSRGQGFFAVTNYNGDRLVQRTDALTPILTHLADAGVGLIYDGSTGAPSLSPLSDSVGLDYVSAYNLIDVTPDSAAISTELLRLRAQASSGASPIGVGFAYPATLEAVKQWVRELDAQSLELAPASYVLNR